MPFETKSILAPCAGLNQNFPDSGLAWRTPVVVRFHDTRPLC